MGIYQCVFKGSQDGQTINIAMGFSQAGGDNLLAAASLAADADLHFQTNLLSQMVDDIVFQSVVVTCPNTPTIIAESVISGSGTVPADPLPQFVVAKVNLRTGLRGRSYQGRWGFPGLAKGDIDNSNGNVLTDVKQGLLQGAVEGFYGDMQASGWAGGVISRFSGTDANGDPIPRPAAIFTEAVSYNVPVELGSRVTRKQ